MLKNIGGTEIIIVAVVLLIIFGPKKLPEFAKGIAEALREFKLLPKEKEKEENETKAKK